MLTATLYALEAAGRALLQHAYHPVLCRGDYLLSPGRDRRQIGGSTRA
jgi:hypothetical protein